MRSAAAKSGSPSSNWLPGDLNCHLIQKLAQSIGFILPDLIIISLYAIQPSLILTETDKLTWQLNTMSTETKKRTQMSPLEFC